MIDLSDGKTDLIDRQSILVLRAYNTGDDSVLFRDLRARKEVDTLDDGRVEGNVSLADKAAFEKQEEKE